MKQAESMRKSKVNPEETVEKRLTEAIQDLCEKRVHGPFESAEAMMQLLRRNARLKQSTVRRMGTRC